MMENGNYHEPRRDFHYPGAMEAPVMSVSDWVIIMILMSIPFVNIVLLIVWAVDSNGNPNRANFAKATLIIMAVSIAIAVVLMGAMAGSIMAFADKVA